MADNEETSTPQIVEFNGKRYNFGVKDWTYLQTKATDAGHELKAQVVSELSGVEITATQVQAFLAMHRMIQESEANRERDSFHGRTVASVEKGSLTMLERLAERNKDELLTNKSRTGLLVEDEKPEPKKRAPRRTAAKAHSKAVEPASAIAS